MDNIYTPQQGYDKLVSASQYSLASNYHDAWREFCPLRDLVIDDNPCQIHVDEDQHVENYRRWVKLVQP